MPPLSFSGVVLVAGVAFLAPLLTELTGARWLPAVVIEIVAGILLGPSVLNWVRMDIPLQVLSLLGLAFLLFLSGLEVEFDQLKGSLLKVIGVSFLTSFLLALLHRLRLSGHRARAGAAPRRDHPRGDLAGDRHLAAEGQR
jgi:Kef-type K+ transport system membrane component KefB